MVASLPSSLSLFAYPFIAVHQIKRNKIPGQLTKVHAGEPAGRRPMEWLGHIPLLYLPPFFLLDSDRQRYTLLLLLVSANNTINAIPERVRNEEREGTRVKKETEGEITQD